MKRMFTAIEKEFVFDSWKTVLVSAQLRNRYGQCRRPPNRYYTVRLGLPSPGATCLSTDFCWAIAIINPDYSVTAQPRTYTRVSDALNFSGYTLFKFTWASERGFR